MNVDLTGDQCLAMSQACQEADSSAAVTFATVLQMCAGFTWDELKEAGAADAALQAAVLLKHFLENGGEIHCVTGGANPGKVLGVEAGS